MRNTWTQSLIVGVLVFVALLLVPESMPVWAKALIGAVIGYFASVISRKVTNA